MKILTVILLAVVLTGCSNMPKDTYVSNGKLIVNTPWGPSSIEGAVIATGKAAVEAARDIEQNTTIPMTVAERAKLLAK